MSPSRWHPTKGGNEETPAEQQLEAMQVDGVPRMPEDFAEDAGKVDQ